MKPFELRGELQVMWISVLSEQLKTNEWNDILLGTLEQMTMYLFIFVSLNYLICDILMNKN